MKLDYEYFTIKPRAREGNRKTIDYEIISKSNVDVLGGTVWRNGWRQHVLMPSYGTSWSEGCLEDVPI